MSLSSKLGIGLEPSLAACFVASVPSIAQQAKGDRKDDNAANEEAVPTEAFGNKCPAGRTQRSNTIEHRDHPRIYLVEIAPAKYLPNKER